MFKSSYVMSSSFSIALCRMSSWCITNLDHQMPITGGTSNCELPSQLHSENENVKVTLCSTPLGYQMPLLGGWCTLTVHCIFNCFLQNVKMTLHSTVLGHQMHLLGSWHWLSIAFSIPFFTMSSWSCIVLLSTTRCLYQGLCLTVHCILSCMLPECHNDLT